MKHYKKLITLILIPCIFFLIMSISLIASASNVGNISIERVEEAIDVSIFYQKEANRLIKCFDVNEYGYYAVGFRNNTIHVYDSLGVFQYGYRFHTEGTYGIALKENSIVIYLGRSGITVEIDPQGKCLDAQEIYFSQDITNHVMNRTSKQVGSTHYFLERDIGIFNGDYSRLVKIDEEENRIVLYDVTGRGYFVGALHYVVLSIFPIACIVVIVSKVKKEESKTDR